MKRLETHGGSMHQQLTQRTIGRLRIVQQMQLAAFERGGEGNCRLGTGCRVDDASTPLDGLRPKIVTMEKSSVAFQNQRGSDTIGGSKLRQILARLFRVLCQVSEARV
ncbi:hypothetical protein NTCA1_48350 [Novosphingobium sp. TCA1]|nr:hypothetical protein NTCA1_48350 [Novosphingobium sp. TCA1]